MARWMVVLVGDQLAPNILPVHAVQVRPDRVLLVASKRTLPIADRLRRALHPDIACDDCLVDPYNVVTCITQLSEGLRKLVGSEDDVVFNLTGGTKLMSLAAFELARERGSRFVYFQTEGNQSRITIYRFEKNRVVIDLDYEIPPVLSLDDYLRLYLGTYETDGPREPLEAEVRATLEADPRVHEVFSSLRPQGLGALEVDFVVRCGSQIGVGEVKVSGAKAGIDLINSVTSQTYLGTYVHKFLVSGKNMHQNNMALARAYRIEVIELPSFSATGTLSAEDRRRLADSMVAKMAPRPTGAAG